MSTTWAPARLLPARTLGPRAARKATRPVVAAVIGGNLVAGRAMNMAAAGPGQIVQHSGLVAPGDHEVGQVAPLGARADVVDQRDLVRREPAVHRVGELAHLVAERGEQCLALRTRCHDALGLPTPQIDPQVGFVGVRDREDFRPSPVHSGVDPAGRQSMLYFAGQAAGDGMADGHGDHAAHMPQQAPFVRSAPIALRGVQAHAAEEGQQVVRGRIVGAHAVARGHHHRGTIVGGVENLADGLVDGDVDVAHRHRHARHAALRVGRIGAVLGVPEIMPSAVRLGEGDEQQVPGLLAHQPARHRRFLGGAGDQLVAKAHEIGRHAGQAAMVRGGIGAEARARSPAAGPMGVEPGSPNQVQVPYSRTCWPLKPGSGQSMKASRMMQRRPAASRCFQNGGLALQRRRGALDALVAGAHLIGVIEPMLARVHAGIDRSARPKRA